MRASAAFGLALFATAFWISSRALASVLPSRGTTLIETKLRWFEEHGAPYDTLFFGSSRAYRGFSPELFDRLTAEQGVETRSFNFGTPGSRAFEIHRMLGRLEGMEHPNIEWVLIDPEQVEWLLQDKKQLMRSYIDWHDVWTTWLVLRYLAAGEESLPYRAGRALEHLRSCGYHVANIGTTEHFIGQILGRDLDDRAGQLERLGPRLDGWLQHNSELASRENLQKHEKFLSDVRQKRYAKNLAKLKEDSTDDRPSHPEATVFYTRIQRRVEELGATPIFITQPGLKLQHELIKAHREGAIHHLLRYDDPAVVPELFEVENRWDMFHSNESGALFFTEMLANDFVALVRELEGGG